MVYLDLTLRDIQCAQQPFVIGRRGTAGVLTVPIILNFFGSATRSGAFSLINGSGNTKLNFAIAIIDGMISRVGIAALLGFACQMGCQGFWYGDALAGFMPMVIGMCYFLSGKWEKRKRHPICKAMLI